jgi:membrane fusion protein (multidrug efflux system)
LNEHTTETLMNFRKPHTLIALAGIALASGLGWWMMSKPSGVVAPQGNGQGAAPAAAARAVGVEVAKAQTMKLQDDALAVGSLKSNQGVMLRPEVAGKVALISFKDGAHVPKGQVLIQLDDALQQAELKQARAQVAVAAANHKRNQELVAKNFISQRGLDESAAALQVAEAQQSLAQARVDRMKIVAPFAGTVGIRNVNVGDYVKDGADLMSIEDLSTMQVDFRLPERYLNSLKVGQGVEATLDALPGRLIQGRITALDPLLDANGRSVAVRASLPNQSGVALTPTAKQYDGVNRPLRPGMFARIKVVFGSKDNAVVVPEEALVPVAGRQFVIKAVVVESLSADKRKDLPADTKLVSQRVEVSLGIRRPGLVEITQGVAAADTVVVAGQQRLQRDGSPIRVMEVGQAPKSAQAASSAAAPASAASAAPAQR